jgi:hypothetical protein
MQKFLFQLKEDDRRLVRKWRLATIGIYGSILAGLVLYTALRSNQEVNLAAIGTRPETPSRAHSH